MKRGSGHSIHCIDRYTQQNGSTTKLKSYINVQSIFKHNFRHTRAMAVGMLMPILWLSKYSAEPLTVMPP